MAGLQTLEKRGEVCSPLRKSEKRGNSRTTEAVYLPGRRTKRSRGDALWKSRERGELQREETDTISPKPKKTKKPFKQFH